MTMLLSSRNKKLKIKSLENANAMLSSSHDELLAKYNDVLKKHDEIDASSKSLKASNKQLKLEYINLKCKYQELELAYDAINPTMTELLTIDVVKVNVSIYCDDLLDIPCPSSCENISSFWAEVINTACHVFNRVYLH